MPRIRVDAQSTNIVRIIRFPEFPTVLLADRCVCCLQLAENRGNVNAIKGKANMAARPVAGSLRPRAALGDLTKITAASSNLVPRSGQLGEEKLKKPVLGVAVVKKQSQNAL